MANEKKIVFSGESSALLKAYDQIRAKANQLGIETDTIAKRDIKAAQEQVRTIQNQIKEFERLNKLQREKNLLEMASEKRQSLSSAKSSQAREQIVQEFASRKEQMSFETLQEKESVSVLKSLLEVAKQQLDNDAKLNEQPPKERGILGDLIKFEIIKQLAKGVVNAVGSFGSSLAGASDDTKFTGALYGGIVGAIPGMAGLASAVQQAKDREEQEQRSRALASTGLRAGTGVGSIGANIGLGLDSAEANNLALQVARARGNSRNLGQNTFEAYAMQKAFGIDQSQGLEQERLYRITGTGGAQNIANTIAALKRQGVIKGNDYSELSELISTQNSFIREQSKLMSNVDSVQAGGIVAAFRQIGGGFAGERLGERISSVNQGLINPVGDLDQAINFAALSQLPQLKGKGLLDLEQAQEAGLSTKGYLGSRMRTMESMYGDASSSEFIRSVAGFTGLGISDSRKLAQMYKANPNFADDFSGTEGDIQKMLGGQPSGISDYEIKQAQIGESFAKGMGVGISKTAEIAGEKMGAELIQDLSKAFNLSAIKSIENIFKPGK